MLFYEKPKNGNVFVALKKKIQTRIELVITGSPHAIKKNGFICLSPSAPSILPISRDCGPFAQRIKKKHEYHKKIIIFLHDEGRARPIPIQHSDYSSTPSSAQSVIRTYA